ncbi:hypothetical protein QZH41_016004 [Actinostola sp. cb2023]|nr:hypothetical protein QZH41_016004 [Actinostola sp. cb2023]
MAERWSNVIAEFLNVTGAERTRAQSLLDATDGNLQMAIEMYFDSGVSVEEAERSDRDGSNDGGGVVCSSSSSKSNPKANTEDEVRAPIPQTRGILVEEPYSTFGTRKRTSTSVFDAFRDFQAEARHQELQTTGEAGSSKKRTLQDLFRPPIDVLHKGTFETVIIAKTSGQQQSKWLLVNVQDVKEFKCQQLNRDVWSNEHVRSMIKANFVLWQVYRDTDEGERFIQFYHVSTFPHLAIVDPRTGEKLISWGFMDAQSFYETVSEFLVEHPGLGEESPPPKKTKKDSIVDASEDSQLEAAIAASLRYSTSTANDNTSEGQNVGEDDDLQFTDSDSDEETWVPQKISKGKTTASIKYNISATNRESTPSTSKGVRTTTAKRKKDNDRNDNKSEIQNNIPTSSSACSSNDTTNEATNEVSSTSSSKNKKGLNSSDADCYKQWQNKDGPNCKIMLRFPHGGRKQVSLHAEAPLLALVQFVQSEGFPNERYEMLTHFPRKKLSYLDFTVTLQGAGLFPHETVFIQER